MADQSKVLEHHPEMADFRLSELVALRGDVLAYRANLARGALSTDAQGFRHSTFKGQTMAVADCLQSERYGLVLGPSTFFGVGIAGNEHCIASLLAERFGFPFANAAMPGGNSRNLNALLTGLVAAARQPPAVVVLSNGGDLANFCEALTADAIFGSPNRMQVKQNAGKGAGTNADANLPQFLTFTSLWTSATVRLCRAYKTPLALVHQSIFFEKSKPSAGERDCALGQPARGGHDSLFERFRKFGPPFYARRQELAKALDIPLAGLGLVDKLTFVDEFHLDRDGTRILSDDIANKIKPLLGAQPAAHEAADSV
jgi:hypothetical protein